MGVSQPINLAPKVAHESAPRIEHEKRKSRAAVRSSRGIDRRRQIAQESLALSNRDSDAFPSPNTPNQKNAPPFLRTKAMTSMRHEGM